MNAEDLFITLKKNMAKLSKSERRRAIESVRDIIRAAMFDDATGNSCEIERCPRCGSVAIVKKGKSRNGEQRYLCRDCGRTFSGSTDRILGASKLPRETWMALAECHSYRCKNQTPWPSTTSTALAECHSLSDVL